MHMCASKHDKQTLLDSRSVVNVNNNYNAYVYSCARQEQDCAPHLNTLPLPAHAGFAFFEIDDVIEGEL